MGKLVKFGEYFYERDPSTTIKSVVDRFLRTGYLSKRNIEDLEEVGISKYEFLKINDDIEFVKNVRNLLYDTEQWDLFKTILFDLDVLYEYGVFELFTTNIDYGLESIGAARGHSTYRKAFDRIHLYDIDLNICNILLKILDTKNTGKVKDDYRNSNARGNGNFTQRKSRWFDVDVGIKLSLSFDIQSMYKNYASFGYTPFTDLKKRACNILINDVMFKFLKFNDIDKFNVECRENSGYDVHYTKFEITVKRTEKSAEQSADFFI